MFSTLVLQKLSEQIGDVEGIEGDWMIFGKIPMMTEKSIKMNQVNVTTELLRMG
jgi:hypothetical protein